MHMVSDRQNRKKNLPFRYLEIQKNRAMLGSEQVKKMSAMGGSPRTAAIKNVAALIMTTPDTQIAIVVRQGRRDSNSKRNTTRTCAMDQIWEISRKAVTALHLPRS